jgi:hypothetical protein
MENVLLMLFAVAVIAPVWLFAPATTKAGKVPDDDPEATVTLAGTVMVRLLLEIATATPPAGAALVNDTVQARSAAPCTVGLAQVRFDSCGAGDNVIEAV